MSLNKIYSFVRKFKHNFIRPFYPIVSYGLSKMSVLQTKVGLCTILMKVRCSGLNFLQGKFCSPQILSILNVDYSLIQLTMGFHDRDVCLTYSVIALWIDLEWVTNKMSQKVIIYFKFNSKYKFINIDLITFYGIVSHKIRFYIYIYFLALYKLRHFHNVLYRFDLDTKGH